MRIILAATGVFSILSAPTAFAGTLLDCRAIKSLKAAEDYVAAQGPNDRDANRFATECDGQAQLLSAMELQVRTPDAKAYFQGEMAKVLAASKYFLFLKKQD